MTADLSRYREIFALCREHGVIEAELSADGTPLRVRFGDATGGPPPRVGAGPTEPAPPPDVPLEVIAEPEPDAVDLLLGGVSPELREHFRGRFSTLPGVGEPTGGAR